MTFARGVALGLIFGGPLTYVTLLGVTCGMQYFTAAWYHFTTLLVIQALAVSGGIILGRTFRKTSLG